MLDRRMLVLAGVPLALGIAIAAASIHGEPQHRLKYAVEGDESRSVTPAELADWIVTGRRDFAVVDMRDHAEYEKGHVRAAVNCASCHVNREAGAQAQHGEGFVDLSKKLVLYTRTDGEAIVLPRIFHDNPNLYRLAGGWEGWTKEVLAPVSLAGVSDDVELDAARRREAVRAFLSGERPSASSEAKLPVTPIKRSGEHKAAGASEGC